MIALLHCLQAGTLVLCGEAFELPEALARELAQGAPHLVLDFDAQGNAMSGWPKAFGDGDVLLIEGRALGAGARFTAADGASYRRLVMEYADDAAAAAARSMVERVWSRLSPKAAAARMRGASGSRNRS